MVSKENPSYTMASEAFTEPMTVIKCGPCIVCHNYSFVPVDEKKWQEYQSGKPIQKVWPDKDKNWREMLITGTHAKCWKEMFGEEE